MLTLYNATVDCDKELAEVYEWARGEYQLDDQGNRVLDDNKLPIPVNPIRFPLRGCLITNTGNRTVISVPTVEGPNFRLDELIKSPEPKKQTKGRKDIYTITGASTRLARQNVAMEHAQVMFNISDWDAEHLPNQRLGVVGE